MNWIPVYVTDEDTMELMSLRTFKKIELKDGLNILQIQFPTHEFDYYKIVHEWVDIDGNDVIANDYYIKGRMFKKQ